MVVIEALPGQAQAEHFLSQSHRLLISGRWVESASGDSFATLNPATESELTRVPRGNAEDIDRAVRAGSDGARATVGGTRLGDRGYFVQPTVLTNTSASMSVEREEIFGPVVCAIPFDDPGQIVPAANDTNFGLAAGVFTRDISKAYRTAKRLRAGTVWVNTYHVFDAALPFGGYKQSGWGREMGHQVLENYLETKSVVTHLA